MLTNAQKAVIHADMIARPELAAWVSAGDDSALANFYSQIVPDFYVFKTSSQSLLNQG